MGKTWIDEIPDANRRQMVRRHAEICFKCLRRHIGYSFTEWVLSHEDCKADMLDTCFDCPYAMELLLIHEQVYGAEVNDE